MTPTTTELREVAQWMRSHPVAGLDAGTLATVTAWLETEARRDDSRFAAPLSIDAVPEHLF